jgi:hypothetical protein
MRHFHKTFNKARHFVYSNEVLLEAALEVGGFKIGGLHDQVGKDLTCVSLGMFVGDCASSLVGLGEG